MKDREDEMQGERALEGRPYLVACDDVFSAEELASAIRFILVDDGMPHEHADLVVHTLVRSSLQGLDEHGVELLPAYLDDLEAGRATVRPNVMERRSGASGCILSADGALGVVAANLAVRRAVELASATGLGVVVFESGSAIGARAYYADLARSKEKQAVLMSGDVRHVAPPTRSWPGEGGAEPGRPLADAVAGSGLEALLDACTNAMAAETSDVGWSDAIEAAAGKFALSEHVIVCRRAAGGDAEDPPRRATFTERCANGIPVSPALCTRVRPYVRLDGVNLPRHDERWGFGA